MLGNECSKVVRDSQRMRERRQPLELMRFDNTIAIERSQRISINKEQLNRDNNSSGECPLSAAPQFDNV